MAKKKIINDSEVDESNQSESNFESESGKGKKKVTVNRSKKKEEMKKSNKTKSNSDKKNKKSNKKTPQKSNKNNSSNKKSNKDDSEDEDVNDLEEKILPGQKYPTPPKGDPVRAFYESMLKQKPNSFMALKHCVEYGCLSRQEAEVALKRLNKIKK